MELGPQQRTQPLGENANKREIEKRPEIFIPAGIPDTPLGWLNSWKTSVNDQTYSNIKTNTDPLTNTIPLDDDTVKHLHQLYIEQPMWVEQEPEGNET